VLVNNQPPFLHCLIIPHPSNGFYHLPSVDPPGLEWRSFYPQLGQGDLHRFTNGFPVLLLGEDDMGARICHADKR